MCTKIAWTSSIEIWRDFQQVINPTVNEWLAARWFDHGAGRLPRRQGRCDLRPLGRPHCAQHHGTGREGRRRSYLREVAPLGTFDNLPPAASMRGSTTLELLMAGPRVGRKGCDRHGRGRCRSRGHRERPGGGSRARGSKGAARRSPARAAERPRDARRRPAGEPTSPPARVVRAWWRRHCAAGESSTSSTTTSASASAGRSLMSRRSAGSCRCV